MEKKYKGKYDGKYHNIFLTIFLKDNEENKRKRGRKIYRALHRLLWPPSPRPPSLSLTAKLNSQTQSFDCATFMADDTPSTTTTTTPLIRPSRRWFSSFRLKTTLSVKLGGSMGDLGTYIPIVLTLTLVNHLDLSTTLIFTLSTTSPPAFSSASQCLSNP